MLAHPAVGTKVELRYAPKKRIGMPHGAKGTVIVAGQRRPLNHLILLHSGELVVVPCGNLKRDAR